MKNAKNDLTPKAKRNPQDIIGTILFISLVLSVIYSFVRLLIAPATVPAGQEHIHIKSDYALMFLQCLLGLIVIALPSVVSRRWKLGIPNFIYVLYYIFLYCAIFLGEVLEFYYIVPHWDTILHFFSGAMLGALGFILVELLNHIDGIQYSLSPIFVALFAFCFALSCGAVWEIYEFTFDDLLGLNMQKYALESGEALVGHLALMDTMKDIIVDALAALLISVLGYMQLKAGKLFKNKKDPV